MIGVVAGVARTMLQGIRSVGSTFASLPFRLSFILVWFFALLFLLFNAPAFYGSSTQKDALVLYMTSLAFVFSNTKRPNPLLKVSAAEFTLTFALWATIGAFLLKAFGPFVPAEHPTLTTASVAVLVTHILVVAVGEELLFRFTIPSLIPGSHIAAQTISAILFGLMHWYAYGGSWPNVLFAIVLGLFFGAITATNRRGLIIAIALHAAYNAFVLGYI